MTALFDSWSNSGRGNIKTTGLGEGSSRLWDEKEKTCWRRSFYI